MTTQPEYMPIMSSNYLKEMPMAMLDDKQAKRNHGQSLARLAERGGICPAEAIAIMDGFGWGQVVVCDHNDKLLKRRVYKYLKDNDKPCAARIQGLDCTNPRVPGRLFCGAHARASNRIILAQHSNESLAYQMQRDGEQQ